MIYVVVFIPMSISQYLIRLCGGIIFSMITRQAHDRLWQKQNVSTYIIGSDRLIYNR